MGKINKQWDNYPTSGLILTIFGRPLNYSTTGTEKICSWWFVNIKI